MDVKSWYCAGNCDAASLDAHSEQRVMEALNAASLRQTTLMVTHQLEDLADWDVIWVMQDGQDY